MGTGRLLKEGGAIEEFTGGVQFRMVFRLVEVSGGVHPLIFCWGRWKNCWGGCLPCWGAARPVSLFDSPLFPWVAKILWVVWVDLGGVVDFLLFSSVPAGGGGLSIFFVIEV